MQRPDFFDVVVASNLFGDILSDLGPACTGTIGIAPSANLNPERSTPSLFEPVHGSAPDIAGKGIANPIGQIWCGAMMLEFLGHKEAHDAILAAIETVLAPDSGAPRTPDIGGKAGNAATWAGRSQRRFEATPLAKRRSRNTPLESRSLRCVAGTAYYIDTPWASGSNPCRQCAADARPSCPPRSSAPPVAASRDGMHFWRHPINSFLRTRGPCEQDRTD